MKEAVRKFKETIELRSSLVTRIRSHRYFNFLAIAALILIISCFHVWQRVTVYELVGEVSTLRKQNEVLNDEIRKVSSDIASLSMSSRVEQYAVDSLGMKPISAEQLFTLVPNNDVSSRPNDLDVMAQAIRRVTDYIPTITETKANARELQFLNIDSTEGGGR